MKKIQDTWIIEYRTHFIGGFSEIGLIYHNSTLSRRMAFFSSSDRSLIALDDLVTNAAWLLMFNDKKNPHRLKCHGSTCKILENPEKLQSKTQEELTELYKHIKEKAKPFKPGDHYYIGPPRF